MEPTNASSPRAVWIIHAAFLTAIPMYAFVVHFVVGDSPFITDDTEENALVGVVLGLLGLLQIPVGLVLPQIISSSLERQAATPQQYLNAIQQKMIISDAFFEAIALMGVIGAFIGMERWMTWGLMLLSMFMLVLNIGRIRGWLDEYERRRKQGAVEQPPHPGA